MSPEVFLHVFQFTTSQGGRLRAFVSAYVLSPFNSRPHKEVDQNTDTTVTLDPLSIHDLTRRSTALRAQHPWCMSSFNSRPHKEVDTYHTLLTLCLYFQFTTSQGGRQKADVEFLVRNAFQFTTSQGGRQVPCERIHDV